MRQNLAPSVDEIKSLVQDYVTANKIKTPFKDGRPGKDWVYAFMKRQKLNTKGRKAATFNPFIVYDFYDVIDKIIKKNNLTEDQLWNCCKSGLPTNPSKCEVVAPVGKLGWKVTCRAGRMSPFSQLAMQLEVLLIRSSYLRETISSPRREEKLLCQAQCTVSVRINV